jgi:multicomponent K+:H+ antiporter subunit D
VVFTTVLLLRGTGEGMTYVYHLGDWPAPFGIVLLVDRLSSLMLVVTGVLAFGSVIAAVQGTDEHGRYYHALFQFQLAGLNGAFLTGDLFNLFVFFEMLLIASYCLLTYGGRPPRLRAALHYVVLNLAGSSLFLVAVGLLYGLTGTLNLADLAVRVSALPAEDAALVRTAALLLLLVFALKAAVAPLHLWLPGAYAAASAPVAALFAIMTKVGVYGIIRVYTLVFGPAAGGGAEVAVPWLLPAALATQAIGMVGALGTFDVRRMQGYFLIASVGTMLTGVGLFSAGGLAAALYYLVHSTLVMGGMFLLADILHRREVRSAYVGGLFLFGAMAVVGLPPFSGFIGKALVLAAAPLDARGAWIWGVTLSAGLIGLLACARIGSRIFWAETRLAERAVPEGRGAGELLPVVGLFGVVLLLTAFAGPMSRFTRDAADQLMNPDIYLNAVLPGARLP